MSALIGALTVGLILSLSAIGIFISYRVFNFPDITTDGSFALGGVVAAALIIGRVDPVVACFVALICGLIAGAITGFLHTRFNIRPILAGILMMTGLYSINLHIMGKSNLPLLSEKTLITYIDSFITETVKLPRMVPILGNPIPTLDIGILIAATIFVGLTALSMYAFFRTHLGTAMRATGNNPQMIRALGVNTDLMVMSGISLGNGLTALSGALLVQYQGFADVQMGIGIFVWGIASLIIGETIIGTRGIGIIILGTIYGSVLFRTLVAIALKWGMNPNDLKLVTAVFVLAALIIPHMAGRIRRKKGAVHA
jgi:putative tryptophan/tyrosine transport system permease protein